MDYEELNPIPCMLYCGPELCNCVARLYYELEAEFEDEDWSIADKKALKEKSLYDRYCEKLQDMNSNAYRVVDVVKSKATCISQGSEIDSVLK